MSKIAIGTVHRPNPELVKKLEDREPFRSHTSLSATREPGEMITGRLPEPDATMLRRAVAHGFVDYVVYSHSTPIAWMMYDGTVIMPEHVYSQTTTRYQKIVRNAMGHVTTQRFRLTWFEDGVQRTEIFYTQHEASSMNFGLIQRLGYSGDITLIGG